MDLAQKFNMLYLQNQAANILSNIYEKKGDYQTALYWFNKSNKIQDSIFSINNTRMIVQFENSFEFEKIIQKQRIEQEKKDLQIIEQTKRNMLVRRYLALSTILALFVMLATLYGYNQKRKHSNLLKEQNEEIRAQNEEIEVQRENLFQLNEELLQKNEVISRNLDEIEKHRNSLANLAWELQERAELIERQRDALFNQKKEITDSIIYAERIQRALLLPNENIKQIFPDGFVFHRPKNIISGDFYWISEIRGFKLFAVADCTGHGVPGGIMSMLGMAYLNDILNKEHITKSSDVLEEMRSRIIQSLRQNKNGNGNGNCAESYDGMDMAMCALNTKTMELQYAGAYLPIYIFRKNEIGKAEPIVVKEDRMPVSQYIKTDPFSNHCIKVEQGDMVYLFSDGYSDQFSCEGNKFNISRFKSLLSSIHHLDGNQQHEIISKTFEEWKGDHFQVDDVLVMGLRI
jgi:serine phosphatase RsbU (regulator of sigma subunit)